jgi:hypothetical protein
MAYLGLVTNNPKSFRRKDLAIFPYCTLGVTFGVGGGHFWRT